MTLVRVVKPLFHRLTSTHCMKLAQVAHEEATPRPESRCWQLFASQLMRICCCTCRLVPSLCLSKQSSHLRDTNTSQWIQMVSTEVTEENPRTKWHQKTNAVQPSWCWSSSCGSLHLPCNLAGNNNNHVHPNVHEYANCLPSHCHNGLVLQNAEAEAHRYVSPTVMGCFKLNLHSKFYEPNFQFCEQPRSAFLLFSGNNWKLQSEKWCWQHLWVSSFMTH